MSLFLRPHLVVRSAGLVAALLASLVLAVAVALAAPSPGPSLVVQPGLPGNGPLAFSAEGRIVLANADGSDPIPATGTDAERYGPVWSPDGTHLAWTVGDGDAVEIADATGHVLMTIPGVYVGERAGVWSPDGTQLLVARPDGTRDHLFLVRLDSPEPRLIGDPDLWAYDAAFSPDGRTIVFRGYGPRTTQGVYVMDAAGAEVRRLQDIPTTGQGLWVPSWTPDGTAVLVGTATIDSVSHDIWRMPVDGSPPVAVITEPVNEYLPIVGPTGRVAYIESESSPKLVVATIDGATRQVIPTPPLEWRAPVWSPDGTRLLVALGDHTGLLLVDAGGASEPLTVPTEGTSWGGGWQPLPS